MNELITYDEIDTLYDKLDDLENQGVEIPKSLTITPEDLEKNSSLIDKRFRNFAFYLLWVSEMLTLSDDDDDRATVRLIKDIFSEHCVFA